MSETFIFIGLKRSGNHGIIHWFSRSFNNDKILENTKNPDIFTNPEKTIVYFNDWIYPKGNINEYKNSKIKIFSYEDTLVNYLHDKNVDPNAKRIVILRGVSDE